MGKIITPFSAPRTKTPFADLNSQQVAYVQQRLADILRRSFMTDQKRKGIGFRKKIHTQAEEKRRADILGRWFRIMREEHDFAVHKTLDHLSEALRKTLDGVQYVPPPASRLWTPDTGVLA